VTSTGADTNTASPDMPVSEGVLHPSEGIHVAPPFDAACPLTYKEDDLVAHDATTSSRIQENDVAPDDAVTTSPTPEVDVTTDDAATPSPIHEVDAVADDVSTPSPYLDTTTLARRGWNPSHPHQTRFKARLQANLSCTRPSIEQERNNSHLPCRDQFMSMISHVEQLQCLEDGSCNFHYPCAFATNIDNDTLHYGDMLRSEDRSQFATAMQKEVDGLWDILQVVKRSDVPAHMTPLPAVWAFKRKRRPDWTILKWKAQLNMHGGRQKRGVNYWETYAPVVNWSTVRLTFILSLLKGFHTKQVDFIQAFTQAMLDTPIYMEVPAGYQIKDRQLQFTGEASRNQDKSYVLKLLKNMYGLRQAGYNWYNHLTDQLLSLGFHQSKVDKCLYIHGDCIILLYVDDCLIFSPSEQTIDTIIRHLGTVFKITLENDVDAYLGIDITRDNTGHLILPQPGLIDKVINICGLEHEPNQHRTPADKILHSKIIDDPPRQLQWSYHQVIGILNYIAATSRPDISFSVHQCARFSNAPTRTHELAVKRIIHYLKGTRDKGYILKPNGSDTNDCYVDADFAGTWDINTLADPASVKSRTGYIITYSGCPILWSSKLQSEIALSTTEAEYISLSTSLRDLILMRAILKELSNTFQLAITTAQTHSTVFEENKGCVDLIAAPTMRPRTRHIAIKYHHFREHVRTGQI
jgi:hypothetical protein